MPRNYISALVPGQQLVFLLPRGSGGRTPTITELNGKIAYRRELSPKVRWRRSSTCSTSSTSRTRPDRRQLHLQLAAPIVNGTPSDLKYAKSISGAPLAKNPNYGHALALPAPFRGRFGLRLTF